MLSGAMLWLTAALAQDPPVQDPPAVIQSATPVYPPAALADKVTGTVILALTLNGDGQVVAVQVTQSVREDIDQAAIEAAKKLLFAPFAPGNPDARLELAYTYTFSLKVEDQQGNPVNGTIEIELVDADGLGIPGAIANFTRQDGLKHSYTADDNGTILASFLEEGSWEITVIKEGFAVASLKVEILPGQTKTTSIELVPASGGTEIVVIGIRQRWREIERAPIAPVPDAITGTYTLTRRDVESSPGALEDVNRAVHKLPGVVSDGDFFGTFSVRGATPEEVVFLLDRVPLDNPFHLAGFNSIFNPDMLAEVKFYAGTPPASTPAGTSAVMEVTSWDGAPKDDRHDLDGAIDLSMSTARLFAMGPIGKGDNLTFALAARRSYIETYFQAMKWLQLLDTAVAAPEYDELSARLAWKSGNHRLLVSALRAGDHLALVDSDDDSTITISGNFKLDNVLYLASLDHLYQLGGFRIQSTTAWTLDSSHMERDFAGTVNRDVARTQYFGRTDVGYEAGKHLFEAGTLAMWRIYDYNGPVEDSRGIPSFAATPIGDYGFDLITLTEPAPQGTISGYAQHSYRGAIHTRAGVRGTWSSGHDRYLVSPSVGLAIPLATATIPKFSAGIYQRVVEEPLLIDPVYGNPNLLPERSFQGVVGIDQGLPIGQGGLVRLEGYFSYLDQLVVKPETLGTLVGGEPYVNEGWGYNYGIDFLFAARGERLGGAVNVSWNQAMRYNPLLYCVEASTDPCFSNGVHPEEYQPITAGGSVEYQVAPRWRLTARYDYHRGRPMSSVEVADPIAGTIQLAGLNDLRMDDFHQLDLRAEWRYAMPTVRWSVYMEVLNVTYFLARSPFLPIATVEEGVLVMSELEHLPTRPFLGIRADF